MRVLLLVICFFYIFVVNCEQFYSVLLAKNGGASLVPGKVDNAVAWGWVNLPNGLTTGWNNFFVQTSRSTQYNNTARAFAAGYLEGALTAPLINSYLETFQEAYSNYWSQNPGLEKKLENWYSTWIKYVSQKIKTPQDNYWAQVALIFAQLEGMVEGYNQHMPEVQQITFLDLVMTNSQTDSWDIINVLIPAEDRIDWTSFKTAVDAYIASANNSHCSAIVRWIQNGSSSELYASHTTWSGFAWMLRIFKYYDIWFDNVSQTSARFSFSSYPTFITSTDDYYLSLDANLLVQETTLSIYNESLYDVLEPTNCLLSWVRVLLANRMASNGHDWCQIFGTLNSGTYNNQWMIVDYNQFNTKTGEIGNNTLWILEQLPGIIEAGDMTSILRKQGYWPSYNVPYFPNIFVLAGYAEMRGIYGFIFSYERTPRALIFREFVDTNKSQNLEDLKFLMQYNDYQNNPLSLGNPSFAISSRFDLLEFGAFPFGGYDSKLTSYNLFQQDTCIATSGPTQQQEIWDWSNPKFRQYSHTGQAQRWDFDWVSMVMPQ